jgi:hypothetical protein
MIIKSLTCLLSVFFFIHHLNAQQLSLELPIKKEVSIDQEVRIKLDVQGLSSYEIKMLGAPSTAKLEENVFKWTPQKQDKNYYLITFHLLDSTRRVIDETNLELTVKPSHTTPSLIFNQTLPDTIKLVENKPFNIEATLLSTIHTDPRALLVYFTYNEEPNLKSFDSCSATIHGDLISFFWTPSNREALQKHLKFRITVIDSDHSVFSQVLNFTVKDINQEPYFKQAIPDTVYLSTQDLTIDLAAIDPDNDKLSYDYFPKQPLYQLQGTRLVIKPDLNNLSSNDSNLPVHLTLTVSDGKAFRKQQVTIITNTLNTAQNPYLPPVIGDFTKKVFAEGDSVLTYLNISNYNDLKKLNITYTDLNLPPGINSLSKHLVFEQQGNYIKVYSKGVLPYSLVNRDYPYNISVLISSKNPHHKPAFRVLVLTVEDRPDPKNIIQQKDTLLQLIHHFVKEETTYQMTLEKVHNRINRPWWKKVAIVTGTVSGVLSLIQSENSNKTISVISASIALLSIVVTNIPSLSEKTVEEINNKIADSKSRIEHIQEKENDFHSSWSLEMDQIVFDKMREEIEVLIDKSINKRKDDVCTLLQNKKINRKIKNLAKQKTIKDIQTKDIQDIFKCDIK